MKQRLVSNWKALSRRKRRLIVWSASLILFYTVFGFAVLPLIIKTVAIKQLSKELDRETTIRQIRINPYVLSATIRGFLVKDKDGEPFLSLDEAYANFQLSSFFGKPWVFKEIWTVNPYCRVQINKDYSLNFTDLAKKFSQPSPKPKAPAKPLFIHVGRFQISGATASFTDQTLRTPFHRLIGPLQITLTEFHTDPNNENPYSFTGTTESGEKLSWTGQFSLEPLQSSGVLALEGLSIPKYAPLFQDLVSFEVTDGVVDGRASYQFRMIGADYFGAVTNATFSLKSFRLADRGGSNELMALDRFAVSGASADTAARTAEVEQISLDGGRVFASRNSDATINLVQMSGPPIAATNSPGGVLFLLRAATNAFAALVKSTNLWAGTIHKLDLTNCSVRWEDLAVPRPVGITVDKIALSARHLSNIAGSNQTANVSLRWNTNGTLRVESSLQISPPASDVVLSVTNLELQPLSPYLEPYLNLFLLDSKVGVDGTFQMRMATNELPQVTFRGSARLDDFATVDAQTEELVKWKSVLITGLDASLQPPSVAIKQIDITEPRVRIAIDTNQTLNFLSLLKNSPASGTSQKATDAPPATAGSPAPVKKGGLGPKLGGMISQALGSATNSSSAGIPKVTVDVISITNGFAQFNDRSVTPAVTTSIKELNGVISDVSSEELKRANIHITAKAAGTGPIEITGKINPLSRDAPTELQVVFQNVDLSPTSPYAGKFLGYRLNRGKLSLQVNYEVAKRQLKATNIVSLDQLTLGEKVQSPDATKLPIKLAVALLKDRNGKIVIDLPIEGNLDDPQFHFGKLILHVLGNVMTKLITSPFAALGAVFGGKGGGEEEASYQDFSPGSAELQAANIQKLDALIGGLFERPGLELQIEGSFDPATDGDGLRKQKLQQEFRRQKWAGLRKSEQERLTPEQVPFSPEEYRNRLQSAYASLTRAAITNETETARSSRATSSSAEEVKGATGLLQKSIPIPSAPLDEKEQVVLRSIQITDADLIQLAKTRALNVRQKILDSGKIDAARLLMSDVASGPATNRATRVYFHLE